MATSDIFNLDKLIAPRLIRVLYVVALVLIVLGMIAGIGRGIAIIATGPTPRLAAAAPTANQPAGAAGSGAAVAPPVRPGRFAPPGPRFGRWGYRGRRAFFMRQRAPVLFGALTIIRVLVLGVIAVMVVRILAEIANAILRMPQRE